MMVDISHVADKTFWDAIAVSKAPVIASAFLGACAGRCAAEYDGRYAARGGKEWRRGAGEFFIPDFSIRTIATKCWVRKRAIGGDQAVCRLAEGAGQPVNYIE